MAKLELNWCCQLLSLRFSCPTPIFAQDLSFKDFPFLIYCAIQGIDKDFYFSKRDVDGVAIHLTPGR